MARLITSGLELGTLSISEPSNSPDGIASAATGITVDTVNARLGVGACQSFAGSNVATPYRQWFFTQSGDTTFVRFYVRFGVKPSSAESPVIFDLQPTNVCSIRYSGPSDAFSLRINGITVFTNADQVVTGQWYRMEIKLVTGVGSTDAYEWKINGIVVASASGISSGTDSVPTGMNIGFTDMFNAATTATIQIDDVALNDNSGADQNSYPGDGKILLLKPAADSAKGTGWTNDQAATTNLFDSVDNTPPIGIADTTAGGGTHQLRNATSNANVNYDATMQTYIAAGLPANAKVRVIVPIIATAAPLVTSAKSGTVGVVSNPTIANIALGAGGTAGTFWSGVTAGTHPTGWKWSYGTIVYNPTITLTTAPVMRVTQVTASTRIAMVDAMGMYVEYQPQSLIADRSERRRNINRRVAASRDRW